MLIEPIDHEYFNWLCAKVIDKNVQRYQRLLQILHETEFVWVIPADEHRAADGIELRQYFLNEVDVERDSHWEELPCSILEMLIAFADRANFQTDMPVKDWFWEFITNLNLEGFTQVSPEDEPIIHDVLDTFIWRTYNRNGFVGILPLRKTEFDQREIELWYQFHEYIDDRGM